MPRTKKTTKDIKTSAIAQSVATVGASKELQSIDAQGREASFKTLSPRQAYTMSIPCHRSVEVIVEQICKAKRMLLTDSGQEITSGACYDFVRKNITKQFIREITSNWLLEGEMATIKPFSSSGNLLRPEGLLAIDSGFMTPYPANARSLEYVEYWQYTDGKQVDNKSPVLRIPSDQLMYVKNFNPNGTGQNRLRGLSPAIVGVQQISGSYFAARFNNAFHQNGHMADITLRFPVGTNKDEAKAVTDYWAARHSIFQNNAFKISSVIADEFEVIDSSQTEKEGNFLKITDYNDESIYALYGIPPVISQRWAGATYDSADVQYLAFYENTLLPVIEVLNDYIQTQLIEPHFADGAIGAEKKLVTIGKNLQKSLDHYSGASIIFRIDPDSLPVASEVKMALLNRVTQFRQSLGLSFKDAAVEAGYPNRPSNAADDLIYIDSTEMLVATGSDPDETNKSGEEVEPEDEGLSTEDQQRSPEETKELRKTVMKYRAEVLRQASTQTVNKKGLISIVKNTPLLKQVMSDYLVFREMFKNEDAVGDVKAYLNTTYANKNLRSL